MGGNHYHDRAEQVALFRGGAEEPGGVVGAVLGQG